MKLDITSQDMKDLIRLDHELQFYKEHKQQ